jgi:hypothetical protein
MEPLTKPLRGTAVLERRERRAALKRHEDAEMRAAKKRDGYRCRVPRCKYRRDNLTMHAAHLRHRSMGGNPTGDRTTRDQLITLCARHHGEFDAGRLMMEICNPQSGTNGEVAFVWRDAPCHVVIG